MATSRGEELWRAKISKSIGIAILALLLAAPANGSSALAQAGSTGGIIGKTDKTLSGERATERLAPARPHPKTQRPIEKGGRSTVQLPGESATGSSPCKGLMGAWTFSNGISVVFKPGGNMSSTNNDAGKWTCENGMVAAHWSKWTDHYVMSSDGARMSGNSGLLNIALTATKN
jgi:hypothetical protein